MSPSTPTSRPSRHLRQGLPLSKIPSTAVRAWAALHRGTLSNDHYTPSEAGRMAGAPRQYVDKWIARGEFEATHRPQSSRRLINVSDIEALRAKRDERRQGVDAMVDTLLASGAEN